MRRRLLIAATTVAAFAALSPAPAPARDTGPLRLRDSSSALFAGGSGQDVSITTIPVRVRGDLAVDFHGDRATGCAARGLCGFSGTVIWQPPPIATLETDAFRDRGGIAYDASLGFFGEGSSDETTVEGGVTTANVRFVPAGSAGASSICTDAAASGGEVQMPVRLRAASLTLAAASPSLLGTRCAGPLQSDIASGLARRVIDLATLLNGRVGVSLASSSSFAVHGLAGTVTSTIHLSLGRAHTKRERDGNSSSNKPTVRTVVISYRAHLDGSVRTQFRGDPASCAPLGSCGADGALTQSIHSETGTFAIAAGIGVRRPVRDALTALGLRKGGNPHGVLVFGLFYALGPAAYAVQVTQGKTTCSDTGPGGVSAVFVTGIGRDQLAQFGAAPAAAHLRCPGPTFSQDNGFSTGTVRFRPLGRHPGTIHLRTGANLQDDGYTGHTTADLALTLSRPKLRILSDALPSPPPG